MIDKRTATALCATATTALALVAASPATAGDGTWNGCKSGNVCLYNGDPTATSTPYQTPGTVPDGKGFWVIANNGNHDPGRDHVRFEYQYYGTSKWYPVCLHYRPDGGFRLDLRDGASPAKIRNMYWGGEC